MKRAYNKEQATYALHKAIVETLKAEETKIEQDYIKAHNIVNPDGSIPTASWMIDDEDTFDTMLKATGDLIDNLGLYEAEKALRKAEDELIRYGLSLMPKRCSEERKILEDACFGLNGQYVHIDTRAKFIEYTMQLDTKTVA